MSMNCLLFSQVTLYKPVVATSVLVHLASDGRTVHDQNAKTLYVELLTEDGTYVAIGSDVQASCENNPVHVPVVQDLSQPFFLTKGKKCCAPRIKMEVITSSLPLNSYSFTGKAYLLHFLIYDEYVKR